MILPRLEIHALDHCTQRCRYCSHGADAAAKRSYDAIEYVPWLERMAAAGVMVDELCAIGGEPFLHPDLAGFLGAARPFAQRLSSMTNLFWLRGPSDLQRHAAILDRLDLLVVTYYRTYGGIEQQGPLVDVIRRRWPRLDVVSFTAATVETFAKIEFHAEPRAADKRGCCFRGCTQLYADGTLARCCVSRRPGFPWHAPRARYDLRRLDCDTLAAWLAEDPLPACAFCSLATEGVQFVAWETT